MKALHRKFAGLEKRKYYHHNHKAEGSVAGKRNGYMSLCIDGMDQAKTQLPHAIKYTKATEKLFQQTVHVEGVLDHDGPVPLLLFLSDERQPQDPNMTCQTP